MRRLLALLMALLAVSTTVYTQQLQDADVIGRRQAIYGHA